MPTVASTVVDEAAAKVVGDWLLTLTGCAE
jgi:hypothetical protein